MRILPLFLLAVLFVVTSCKEDEEVFADLSTRERLIGKWEERGVPNHAIFVFSNRTQADYDLNLSIFFPETEGHFGDYLVQVEEEKVLLYNSDNKNLFMTMKVLGISESVLRLRSINDAYTFSFENAD